MTKQTGGEQASKQRILPWQCSTAIAAQACDRATTQRQAKRGRSSDDDGGDETVAVAEQRLELLVRKQEFRDVAARYFSWWEDEGRPLGVFRDGLTLDDECRHVVTIDNLGGLSRPPAYLTMGRVVVFDLETTGFTATDAIVEIGAVELIDGRRTGTLFQAYCKPRALVSPMAYAAHRLSDDFLSRFDDARDVLLRFVRFVDRSPLVAHNLAFDRRMLMQDFDRLAVAFADPVPRKGFCTMLAFRALYPQHASATLDAAAKALSIDCGFHRLTHGALVDAELTAALLLRMIADHQTNERNE